MILIWKGAGGVVAIIWFISIFAGDRLARAVFGDEVSNGLCNLTGEWLAAAITLALALVLRSQRERWPDAGSGQVVEARAEHSLFFIPVLIWPAIFGVLGIVVYFSGKPPAPKLVEITPRGLDRVKWEAVEKGAPRNWYLRLEAHWPEGVCSLQHKLEIITGPVKASDFESESQGIRVAIPKRQVEMFRGAQLDFSVQWTPLSRPKSCDPSLLFCQGIVTLPPL